MKLFYLGVNEVTNTQWRAVMGDVPSHWKDDNRLVETLDWGDAVVFCQKHSQRPKERAAWWVYWLPPCPVLMGPSRLVNTEIQNDACKEDIR